MEQLLSVLLGWIWSRLLEKRLSWLNAGKFTGFLRGLFVAIMCVITAIVQVWYEQGLLFNFTDLGSLFQYFAIIFLASQAVWELRGKKLQEGDTILFDYIKGESLKELASNGNEDKCFRPPDIDNMR